MVHLSLKGDDNNMNWPGCAYSGLGNRFPALRIASWLQLAALAVSVVQYAATTDDPGGL